MTASLAVSRNPGPSVAGSKPAGGTMDTWVPATQTAPGTGLEPAMADGAAEVAADGDTVAEGSGVADGVGASDASLVAVEGSARDAAVHPPSVATARMTATRLFLGSLTCRGYRLKGWNGLRPPVACT